ncbi:hypothetical protein HWI79_2194 [Cryptosporidium felis]|nr:hypothetical protein HWI79_2194 [Cryptosporidium felis]
MRNIQNEYSNLFQTCLTKVDDYFILDLKTLASKGYLNTENLGSQLRFSCSTTPPKELRASCEDIVVSIPIGIFNSTQLRKLAQIVENLVSLDQFKYFRFFDFLMNFANINSKCKEYFLLDVDQDNKIINGTQEESIQFFKTCYDNNIGDSELCKTIKPLISGTIKKKIAIMQGLLDHFTKNTNLLINQIMDKFDEKSVDLNRELESVQNKILLQEAKVNRLNNISWKILKEFGIEKEFDLSENDTIIDGLDDNIFQEQKLKREILTLQEALQIRRSHGGEGLPEDFESPEKLLQHGKVQGGAPHNCVDEAYLGETRRKDNLKWDPVKFNDYQCHMYFRKINLTQTDALHPAIKELAKLQAGISKTEDKSSGKIVNISDNIYDPILEYSIKNSFKLKNGTLGDNIHYSPTVFSYLGRPIPVLNHQEIPFIPKQRVMESIQHSMNTEISKNERWKSLGRPMIKKEMKVKESKGVKIEPLDIKANSFDISKNEVYNILL